MMCSTDLCVVSRTVGILIKNGLPSGSGTVLLFNGDVADRGEHAVEILLLLMAFKLHDPPCVHLNRGNHEVGAGTNRRPRPC